jgi:hypothetical protein
VLLCVRGSPGGQRDVKAQLYPFTDDTRTLYYRGTHEIEHTNMTAIYYNMTVIYQLSILLNCAHRQCPISWFCHAIRPAFRRAREWPPNLRLPSGAEASSTLHVGENIDDASRADGAPFQSRLDDRAPFFGTTCRWHATSPYTLHLKKRGSGTGRRHG